MDQTGNSWQRLASVKEDSDFEKELQDLVLKGKVPPVRDHADLAAVTQAAPFTQAALRAAVPSIAGSAGPGAAAPAGGPTRGAMHKTSTTTSKAIMAPLDEQVSDLNSALGYPEGSSPFATQLQGVDKLQGMVDKYNQRPQQLDLSPLMALTDTWTGSKLAQGYQRPQTPDDRAKEALLLEDTLQKQKQAISKDAIDLLKAAAASKGKESTTVVVGDSGMAGARYDAMDQRAHTNILQSIKNDQSMNQRAQQFNNLENATAQAVAQPFVTPQSFHELQQAVRSNLGIRGQMTGSERGETYINNIELGLKNLEQRIYSSPQGVPITDPNVQHVLSLVAKEQEQIRSQAQNRLNARSVGFDSMYARRPDYAQDLDAVKQNTLGQFNSSYFTPGGPLPGMSRPAAPAPAAGSAPASGQAGIPAGYIRVRNAQTGEEHVIPAGDFNDAEREGFGKV